MQNIVASRLVGVPQWVACVGKCLGQRFYWGVDALALEHLDKRQVHIDVVIQSNRVGHRIANIVHIAPRNVVVVAHRSAQITELRRSAISHTYGLTGPTAFDFIHQLCAR